MKVFALLDLNVPQTRQNILRERIAQGKPLIAQDLATQLGISIDTVRRDLIALEQRGLVRRVRGGALPVTPVAPPYAEREASPEAQIGLLADRAVRLLDQAGTVFLDAGTTTTAIAARLPESFAGLIVTPAPSVALAALRRGARVHIIGGALCPDGAMATGAEAERAIAAIAADVCVLGACGLWPEFGISAEDAGEAGVKRAMAQAASQVVVVASVTKLARRGRHRVLPIDQIDVLVSDAPADDLVPFRDADVEVLHV